MFRTRATLASGTRSTSPARRKCRLPQRSTLPISRRHTADPHATYDLVTTYPGACRNRHIDALWAQAGLSVYAYEFNDQNAPYYYPPMPGFTPLAAAHTIDIQFLFPLWHGGILGVPGASQSAALSKDEQRLSDQIVAAWTNFAKTGNPNESGNMPWPRFANQEG